LAGAMIAIVAIAASIYAVFGPVERSAWTVVGTVSDVRHREISYDKRLRIFVVARGSDLVSFADVDPLSHERILFCPSSGWFESTSGASQFDRHGYFREGPDGRGLDRVAVREEHGFVTVNTSLKEPGAPASVTDGSQPAGQYCHGRLFKPDLSSGRWVPLPQPTGAPPTG